MLEKFKNFILNAPWFSFIFILGCSFMGVRELINGHWAASTLDLSAAIWVAIWAVPALLRRFKKYRFLKENQKESQ